jgi:hypothetical protein
MIRIKNDWLSLIVFALMFLFISCSDKSNVQTTSEGETMTPSLGATVQLKSTAGHIYFSVDLSKWTTVTAKSVEEPDVRIETLSEGKFALLNLIPGRHTLFVESGNGDEKAVAVLRNVVVEAGTAFDVGLVPLQSAGSVRGRAMSLADSSPIANAKVFIKDLGLGTVTDSSGNFTFDNLPEGHFELSAFASSQGSADGIFAKAESKKSLDLGDIWLGEWKLGDERPKPLNAPKGITKDKVLLFEGKFPTAARYFRVVDQLGEELLGLTPVRKNFSVTLNQSGRNLLRFIVYDAKSEVLGQADSMVFYDPFSDGQSIYTPNAAIMSRAVVSPNRTFTINQINPHAQATQMKIAFKSFPDSANWVTVQNSYNLSLPQKNSICGKHEISIQFRNADGLVSREQLIPVTLSCWQRVIQRGLFERLVGIENAATWTGEYAFVWSGKLTKIGAVGVRGSYSKQTTEFMEKMSGYRYMDGGYIYRPSLSTTAGNTSRMEMIVTDYTPSPRAQTGVGGRLVDPSGTRKNLIAVYGGEVDGQPVSDGAIYHVETNAWISMQGEGAPSPRIKPSVFFVSDFEVLVWGGLGKTNLGYDVALGDGAIYNMKNHSWRPMSQHLAPSPRFAHAAVWSGGDHPEFVVLGGKRPGEVYLDSGARYSPATDTWLPTPQIQSRSGNGTSEPYTYKSRPFAHAGVTHTRRNGINSQKGKVIVFGGKAAHGEYLRNGFIFDLDSNTISQYRIPSPAMPDVIDLYLDPTIFVDGDGGGSSDPGNSFWVVSGRASEVSGDLDTRILIYNFHDGQIGANLTLQRFDNYGDPLTGLPAVLNGPWVRYSPDTSVTKYNITQCCEDWLAFHVPSSSTGVPGKSIIMNGTATFDSSVYADTTTGTISSGRTISSTTQVAQSKTNLSFEVEHDPSSGNTSFVRIDTPTTSSVLAPKGPRNIFETGKPVFDPTSRKLIIYGGKYTSGIGDEDHSINKNNWMLDVDSRQWSQLGTEASFSESRLYAHNFFLAGKFFQIGGIRYEPPSGEQTPYNYSKPYNYAKYDGFSLPFSTAPAGPVTPILTSSAAQDFDFSAFNDSTRTNSYSPKTCKSSDKMLFIGGRRYLTRTVTGIPSSPSMPALIQKPVLFDGNTSALSYPAANTLLDGRNHPTVVETPSGCFVWGGYTAGDAFDANTANHALVTTTWEAIADNFFSVQPNGSIYNFTTNSWTPVSSSNSPPPRAFAHGVWTGQEVLIWGGMNAPRLGVDAAQVTPRGISFYNPSTAQWRSAAPAQGEPFFRGRERPVWTGQHMFIWKNSEQDNTHYFTPSSNSWGKIPLPAGFGLSSINYDDTYVEWTGDKLFVMPSSYINQISIMAFFVPPDP